MNYSIECRVPLASLEFMHLCQSAKKMPEYINSFGTKGIVKDIAEKLNVPRPILSRKKHGFPPEENSFSTFLSSAFVEETIRTSDFCAAATEGLPYCLFDDEKAGVKNNVFNDLKFSLLNIALLGI